VLVAGACGLHLHPARFHSLLVKNRPLRRLEIVDFVILKSLRWSHGSSS
jgi:hypothetical protein